MAPAVVTFTVGSLANSGRGTLRQAITKADRAAARKASVINIVTPGTITLERALPDLKRNITINSLGASTTTVRRDPGPSTPEFSVFKVDARNVVRISGLTFMGGYAKARVLGRDIFGNVHYTGGYGGGLDNHGTLTVNDCIFSGNSARLGGGLANSGTATVIDSTFTDNSALIGGGLYNEFLRSPRQLGLSRRRRLAINHPTVTMIDSTFTGNSALGLIGSKGGGFFNEGTASVSNSTFTMNRASYGGGGIENDGTANISGSTFTANDAFAISLEGAVAFQAGGGLMNNGVANVSGCTFFGNGADDGGGGLANLFKAAVTVIGSTFTRNIAYDSGGGLYNEVTASVSGCTFTGNSAVAHGGGLFNSTRQNGVLTQSGNTFTGNGPDDTFP